MDIDDVVAAANALVVDDEQAQAMEARIAEAENEFEQDARSKSVTEEFLSLSYSL